MKDSRNWEQYAGFTLFECLLALFFFSFICLVSSGYLKNAQVLTDRINNTSEKEWHIFLIQLENEMSNLELISVTKEQIYFHHQEADYPVIVEFKQNKIIKAANGGYQPLLMKIEKAEFRQQEGKIELEILFENGKNKVGCFII
ncbi:ComGF family competence protein [Enterococcus sp. BWB1-3]|uniref:competence type IV pilus minor pilin ComGF n=1 Tax=unclassified Enterococcus TaxID=2608891 RepID=UPI0019250BBD|nr:MULTISPECIES: competence type IV pilus minor pilin ComGF [unclassified Enterococcus]MBL1228106.1 ComGF family competence protein [Enterococcus sp. BWB1-3]MCB5951931.1 ComGF family competence protein [Enterococcus sp. BWT-B8]MCB5954127.1 ComGF family competence protein [Enterococcus sp. CWB-B31]